MALSINSTIKTLLADEEAKAVLEKHLPGVTKHPQIGMVYYMTLRSVATYPEARQAGLTREKLEAIDQDLQAL